MTFLNTAFLFLLSAVSIPLIIHFLSKRRIKTIEFSSLKFLEQMQKSRMRWLRIKELILLALRMLVIALIVLAFARPTLRGFAGSSRASSSAVIILDRSVSMDAEGETGSLFEEGKRLAAKLLDSFERGDRVTLITYPGEGAPEIIGPFSPGEMLKQRLGSIELSHQAGNIGEALKAAREALAKNPNFNREVYIISDMQAGNFANLPREVTNRDSWKNVHFFAVAPRATGGDNISIDKIIMPAQLMVPYENFEIGAELTYHGRGRLENSLVGVVVDGERKAQTTVSLPAGQPTRIRFSLKVDTPGDHGGYVEIDHDSFEPDNRRYFSFHIPQKIRLLAVSQSGESASPVRLALDRPEAGQIEFTGISVGDLLREDLSGYDVVLLDDIASLDDSRESAIVSFLEGGKGLFVSLGRSAVIAYWQKFLSTAAGISVGPLTGKDGEYIVWDNFDYEHPIFAIYSPTAREAMSIPELRLFFYHAIQGGRMIGSTSRGIGMMAESASRPLLVIGCGLDLTSSDLPAHSFFIPLVVRSVEYLGSRDIGGGGEATIGRPTLWHLASEVTTGLTLLSPENTVENLQPNPGAAGSSVRISEYGRPGIYKLMTAPSGPGRQISLLAFNIDNSESQAEFVTAADLGERLGIDIRQVSPDTDLKAAVLEARFGRELWKEFLTLALVLLIIESILGRTAPPKKEEGKSA
jgi:hypothetical protein